MNFRLRQPTSLLALFFFTQSLIIFVGCSGNATKTAEPTAKPPKPVSTMVLKQSSPSFQHHTTASVAPWKAERIGFEQPGRVVQVIEPNEMVTGRGTENAGVPLARLDDEQFRIAVDAAKADAVVAERRRDSNLIAIEQRLPTAIKTAEAELRLAETELDRAERLANSISKSELDSARTLASTATLRVASAKSELAQSNAEQLALDAQVQQANQRIAEAERNLKNTVLFSSFPGQIAEVHAVPGSYVKEGDPIVTVQMVDPMLVEFEVTADNSRLYQRGDTLGVTVTNRAGKPQILTGMVYTVDTLADENTRTFTVSLLVRNQSETESSQSPDLENFARTTDIFPLNLGPVVTGDKRLLVEQNAIHHINGESFVWKITNREWNQLSDAENRVLVVQRLKVKVTSDVIPFLGNWNFVAIEFDDPSGVDLDQDLITGRLFFEHADDPSLDDSLVANWNGDRVVMEQIRWMLRAGDTVRVAMIPKSSSRGFYVPMKAVRRENGKTFVHVVAAKTSPTSETKSGATQAVDSQINETTTEATAKRVMVNVTSEDSVLDDDLMLCIEPVTDGQLQEDLQIIVGGTHYLDDGDHVRIVPQQRASEGGR